MDGFIRIGPFVAAIIILIVTRGRWLSDLTIPENLWRWFIASLWLVYPIAFFFVGLALEHGRMFTGRGLVTVSSILLVLWLLTGFPHIFSGVFRALQSWKVRKLYAEKHRTPYLREKIIRDLYPKGLTASPNFRLKNALEVSPTVSIVTAFKLTRLIRSTQSKGVELVIIEGVPSYGSIIATYNKKETGRSGKGGILGKNYIEIGASCFLVLEQSISSLKEMRPRLQESDTSPQLSAAKETVKSILMKIEQKNPVLLQQVAGLYLNDRRMILELKEYLDTEEKLVLWVDYVKTIRQRSVL